MIAVIIFAVVAIFVAAISICRISAMAAYRDACIHCRDCRYYYKSYPKVREIYCKNTVGELQKSV